MIQRPPVAGSGSAHEVFSWEASSPRVTSIGWPGHAGEGWGNASLVGVVPLTLVHDDHSVLDGLLPGLYKICYRS